MATFNELLQRANVIKNEVVRKANTALRVGSWMSDLLTSGIFLRKVETDNTLMGEGTVENPLAFIKGNEGEIPRVNSEGEIEWILPPWLLGLLENQQIAFGDVEGKIKGSSNYKWDDGEKRLIITAKDSAGLNPCILIVNSLGEEVCQLDSLGNILFKKLGASTEPNISFIDKTTSILWDGSLMRVWTGGTQRFAFGSDNVSLSNLRGPSDGTRNLGSVSVRWGAGYFISLFSSLINTKIATFSSEHNNANSGASKTIDWNNGQNQKLILTADCTLTFANITGSGYTSRVQLKVIQDTTGGWGLTFPANVIFATPFDFANGTAGQECIITFYFDGTNYIALSTQYYNLPL
jgi:hypothetical protein